MHVIASRSTSLHLFLHDGTEPFFNAFAQEGMGEPNLRQCLLTCQTAFASS